MGQLIHVPSEENASATLLLFQRLERRFRQSHSLKHLYFYVFCHPESPDNFDVTTNFPRTVLRCRPEQDPATFEEAGLGSSVMLFVNDLDA